MEVREAAPADRVAIVAVIKELVNAFGERPAPPDRLDAFVGAALEGRSGVSLFVASEGETLAGLVSMAAVATTRDAGLFGYIDDLYVRPAFRGRGIGRALLAKAIESAATRGFCELRLSTDGSDPRLLAFHEAAGFRRSGAWLVRPVVRDWSGRRRP
jgi:ribosomal protein S18 acetylase RimI-like enzyme